VSSHCSVWFDSAGRLKDWVPWFFSFLCLQVFSLLWFDSDHKWFNCNSVPWHVALCNINNLIQWFILWFISPFSIFISKPASFCLLIFIADLKQRNFFFFLSLILLFPVLHICDQLPASEIHFKVILDPCYSGKKCIAFITHCQSAGCLAQRSHRAHVHNTAESTRWQLNSKHRNHSYCILTDSGSGFIDKLKYNKWVPPLFLAQGRLC